MVRYVVLTERTPIRIVLVKEDDSPFANLKCKVVFPDGQTLEGESDASGVITLPRKADGEFKIQLMEEEETT